MNQQAQALENAASGERVTHSIHFPATGDEELDCLNHLICTIQAYWATNSPSIYGSNQEGCKRILQFFFARTQHIHGLPVVREVQVSPLGQGIHAMPYTPPALNPIFNPGNVTTGIPTYSLSPETWAGIQNPPTK